MAGFSLGDIVVKLKADTADLDRGLSRSQRSISIFGKITSVAGRIMASAFRVVKTTAIAAAAAIGFLLVKNIRNAVKRADTLKAFPRVLKAMGISAKDAQKATDKLNKSLIGLPTPLEEGTRGVQQFIASGLKAGKATDAYLAMNNALLASGQGAQETQIVMQSLTRALSGGKTAASTIQAALSRMPTALKALQEQTGKSAGELFKLYAADPQKLADALIKLNKEGGGGLESLEKQAREATKGIETSWDNMNTAIARALANLLEKIGTKKISAAIERIGKGFEKAIDVVGDVMIEVVPKIVDFGKSVIDGGRKVANFLLPALTDLWKTIESKVIPTLSRLWKEVGSRLVAAFAGLALTGIKVTIQLLNVLLQVVTPIINKLIDFKEVVLMLAAAFATLKIINVAQLAIAGFAGKIGLAVTAIKSLIVTMGVAISTLGVLRGALAMLSLINPLIAAITALGVAAGLLSKHLNKNAEASIKASEASGELADKVREEAVQAYRDAKMALDTLTDAALGYLSVTNQLNSAETAVKVARQKLIETTKRYGKDSQKAKEAQARLSESEARHAAILAEKDKALADVTEKVNALEKAHGPLKQATRSEINANLKSVKAIRDNMRARGEDTTAVDKLIKRLQALSKKNPTVVKTKAQTSGASRAISNFIKVVKNIPTQKIVRVGVIEERRKITSVGVARPKGKVKVGNNALGTNFWRGGMTWVGERGPELVNLPRGSQVVPNHKSFMSKVNINGPIHFNDRSDIDYFINKLNRNNELERLGISPRGTNG